MSPGAAPNGTRPHSWASLWVMQPTTRAGSPCTDAYIDPDWTRALITVVRYAEGMRSTLATYLRADLQAGRRQGDFHYAHEEMAMSMVISATLGAMNLLVEDGEVEHADRIAAEVVLQALGGGRRRRLGGLLGSRSCHSEGG